MEMKLPILIIEGLDVQAFPSVQSAQSYLEPWWVMEERGQVYDASARRITASCRDQKVVLNLDPASAPQVESLAKILRAHLRATGRQDVKDDVDLAALIAAIGTW